MTWTTDNRWAPGASRALVPDDAPAAYSARWIDHGDFDRADVLPDRQGFAYDDHVGVDRLCSLLQDSDSQIRVPYKCGLDRRDVTTVIVNHPDWKMYGRRSGGYIYVDAWLNPKEG